MADQPPYGADPWQTQQPGNPPNPPNPAYPPAGYPPADQAPTYPPPGYPGMPPVQPGYPPAGYGQPAYAPPPGYGQPGYPPTGYPQGYPGQPAQPERGGGMAVAGLILGIISIPAAFTVVCGFLFGLLGIIFGVLGRRSASRRTMATVAIVLSVIGLGLTVLITAAGAALVNSGGVTTAP